MSETLCENTVYSFLYPTIPLNESELEELCESINNTVQKLSLEYIWHRDEYRVNIPIKNDEVLSGHLVGVTCFGDNIEDEWFIVYLLFEISKTYPNVVIQVYDNDGEFLLIEAADYLPTWANPENTKNRVFIYQGSIHLLPPSNLHLDSEVDLNSALKIVIEKSYETNFSTIEKTVFKRIGNFPKKIIENIHRAVANLPLHIATLLTLKPTLISPIVSAYCNHDVIDAKACKNVKLDKNCVKVPVKFTRCLYAMLLHSKPIKTVKAMKIYENDKKTTLGLKITCGFEIIMTKVSGDIFSSKEFTKFLQSLTDNGYFKENLEGSKNYKLLLDQAKKFFLAMECPINTQVCNQISQLMKTEEFTNLQEIIRMKPQDDNLVEDNDDWLNITPDQLNNLLKSRYGQQTKLKSDDIIDSKSVTSELTKFLKQTSDFEGIETELGDEEKNINFNSDEFMESLNNMIDFLASGKEQESDIDDEMEDYSSDEMEEELKEKLNTDQQITSNNSKFILQNMIQSMKEEAGSTGPSSNIFRNIGINKTDILDSDDDEE